MTGSLLRRALVVGAGPAGLTAALSLVRAGVGHVEVAERGGTQTALGSELSVSSAMLRSLERLGLAERVAGAGVPIDGAQICLADGTLLADIPFPKVTTTPGLPASVGISRPALHRVLGEAAAEAGVVMRPGTAIAGVEESADGVEVTTEDGDTARFDLVVAADGVRSLVRAKAFPAAPEPRYGGQVAWRARVPRRTGPLLAIFDAPDRRAGLITVADDFSYLFVLQNVAVPERRDPAALPAAMREVLAPFGGAVAEIRDTVVDPATVHYTPLTPVLVPSPWHTGRIVLIGDAAHATTPHLAYGAGLAVEDGVVFGEVLAGASDLGTALARFSERRFERARHVVETGVEIMRLMLLPEPPAKQIAALTMQGQAFIAQEP